MASVTLNVSDRHAPGVTVGAYPRSNWTQGELPPTGAAVGSATTTAVVSATGTLTFTGLADATGYYAARSTGVGGYVSFSTPKLSGTFATSADVSTAVSTHEADTTAVHGIADTSAVALKTETVNTVAATGATETLPDVGTATMHLLTLDANCTLTFPTAAAGKSFTLALKQDATGSRTVTWPAAVTWAGGVAPTLTTTAAKTDMFSFVCVNGTDWRGFTAGLNFT